MDYHILFLRQGNWKIDPIPPHHLLDSYFPQRFTETRSDHNLAAKITLVFLLKIIMLLLT